MAKFLMTAKVRGVKDAGFPGRADDRGQMSAPVVRKILTMLADDGKNLVVLSEFVVYPDKPDQKSLLEGSLRYDEITDSLSGKVMTVGFEATEKSAKVFYVQHVKNAAAAVGTAV